MTLIKSISGIRGTLENIPGESLSDYDVEQFTLAYYQEIISPQSKKVVVIGRDARKSGPHIVGIVTDVLVRNGCDIIDLGLVTTPTLGVYTNKIHASGGIMVSASHNDDKWNALKLLNNFGEFLSPDKVSLIIGEKKREYEPDLKKGKITHYSKALEDHINLVSSQECISIDKISKRNFRIAVDGINSVGGIALPSFLECVGVKQIEKINCDPSGEFAHNPEPLPENINDICNVIKTGDFDLGVVVDPDADRLCLVDENGVPFGEEYTLVAAAEHIISNKKNPITCSNLSSSIALKKITEKYSGKYFSAPVGEINVVETMKDVKADIGGEGNGGVIFPSTHYGRDSLVGIGLILTLLSERDLSLSKLKSTFPQYHIYKSKTKFEGGINQIIKSISNEYSDHEIDLRDGIRINFEESWTHIRKSNTEPVVRVISEASTLDKAKEISKKIISKLHLS